jgi:hypothetical protein
MRIRIVTFGLNIPADAYTAYAVLIAPEFAGLARQVVAG